MKKDMRIITLLFMLCLVGLPLLVATDGNLELIKTIGDERDDYTLLGIADAVLTENNDIYILNARGNFVSRYSWDGTFKEKVGERGQGPKDLFFPKCLIYAQQKLYIIDNGNKRIAEIDPKTGKFNYYRETISNQLTNLVTVLDNTRFLGVFETISKKRGRIGILDKNFNLQMSFFDKFPIDIEIPDDELRFRDGMTTDKIVNIVVINSRFLPTCAYEPTLKEVLVSFRYPNNTVRFFVYSVEGKLLREFSYTIKDKKYKFDRFLFNATGAQRMDLKKYPERFDSNLEVFYYKSYYVAMLTLNDYKAQEDRPVAFHNLCLIFDRSGKLVKEFPINNDLYFFQQSNGYFLGMMREQDIEKLYIYEVSFK